MAGPTFKSLVLKPLRPNATQHYEAAYNDVQEEEEEEQEGKNKNLSKRQNPGNNNVHHHAQINYLDFRKANSQKALRQLTSDDNEKHRKQYLYGRPDVGQYRRHRHHSRHEAQQSPTNQQQQPHKTSSAVVVPQSRIVTKSHPVAERMKDSRLNGADLYVARLGKKGNHNHYDCGCRHDKHTAEHNTSATKEGGEFIQSISDSSPKAKTPTGSLHDELRFPSLPAKEKSPLSPTPKSEQLTATHSRPCYRCISYMHSAGIKRVFWTNNNGDWEGGKVRELVDALEAPMSPDSGGGARSVYVTKSEVLLLKGLI